MQTKPPTKPAPKRGPKRKHRYVFTRVSSDSKSLDADGLYPPKLSGIKYNGNPLSCMA